MSNLLSLHDYQEECVNAIRDSTEKRVAAIIPTGGGKTLCFAHLGKRYLDQYPNRRVLILSHTDELVNHAREEFSQAAPHLGIGIVKGNVREVNAPVISASVASLHNTARREEIQDVGLIIVDESHHARAPSYMRILEHYGAFNDDSPVKTVGFTATLSRGDKKSLADVWERVVFSRDILWMIRHGYLLDVRGKRVEVPDLDFSGISKRAGDYAEGQLGRALTGSLAPELTAKAYAEHASDRSGLLFAPTVASAIVMAQALREVGITSEVVHGNMAIEDRREVIGQFNRGDIQVISNCMILTEGFNAPRASCVVIARATRSAPLYQQMVGRALRLFPGQSDALILDVVGASLVHDLRSLVDLTDVGISYDEEKSLSELVEIAERETAPDSTPIYYGPTQVKEFNPLVRDSKYVWLTSRGGSYFLSAGEVYVFLVPSERIPCTCSGHCLKLKSRDYYNARKCIGNHKGDMCITCKGTAFIYSGTWSVAWCSKINSIQYPAKTGDMTDHTGLDLEYAFAWGEDVAQEMRGVDTDRLATKGSKWRGGKASYKAMTYAYARGMTVWPGMTAGELSDSIAVDVASGRIDEIVTRLSC